MNSPSNNYWFMFKHFCPKENHNYTYNSNYPKNKHSQKALSSTLRRPQKCTTPLQSSTLRRAWTCTKPTVICSKTQNFSALQKASLQKRKNAEEETQTQNSNYHNICCKQNSVQNSSNYHAPEWGLNPETCSMEKTHTNVQKNFDSTTISLMLREQPFVVQPQYRPQHRLCSCGAKLWHHWILLILEIWKFCL